MQPPEDIDLPMQKDDFRAATISFRASRDVGAQIFCAMLRSVGVDARLVCSLQPLPFQTAPKVVIPPKKYTATIVAEHKSRSTTPEVNSDIDPIYQKMNPAGGPMTSLGGHSHIERGEEAVPEAAPSPPRLHPGREFSKKARELAC